MILFSDHAKEQYKRRKISKREILETIKKPDVIKDSFKQRKLRIKKFGDKILEVVTSKEGNNIIVITQYYLGE